MSRRAAPHRGADVHYGDADDERPSRSELKRQSTALQDLGMELAELSDERLTAADMPESLRDALLEYRRTRSHEGRRRQMQYVGKLMRTADEAPLREAVASAKLGSARDTLVLHETESWRSALLADDEALTRWMQQHPADDAQHLRSLVRAARREATQPEGKRNPRPVRDLFQHLRPMVAEQVKAQHPLP